MILTERCTDFLRLLYQSRWLDTDQVHRRYFAHATKDAARKRLRKLAEDGYVRAVQKHRMQAKLFTLGPRGKYVLEELGISGVRLESRPPTQIEHLLGINSVRVAIENA